jgi:carotenoid cleavage dioxygenase
MDILKTKSVSSESPKQPDNGRRSFIWKTGAAMSAVLASAVAGMSKPTSDRDSDLRNQVDRLSNQVGSLEDAMAIRRLHQAYECHLDKGMYDEVVNLFADDGEVVFNGGVFAGKEKGIRRLYCNHFSSGLTGKKIEPAPGFQPNPAQQQDIVEIAPDRKSAKAQFPYSMQVGTPMTEDSQLVQMARLQGEGILKWWEAGIHEVSYVKVGDSWKIKRLCYQVKSKADYKPGRSYAKPIEVPLLSKTYPADPTGPDRLIAPTL